MTFILKHPSGEGCLWLCQLNYGLLVVVVPAGVLLLPAFWTLLLVLLELVL